MENYLVGGYFDRRIFKGEEAWGKTPFGKDINIYTLDQALKLPYCSEDDVKDFCDSFGDEPWDELDELEKCKLVERYLEDDELTALILINSLQEAVNYVKDTLLEIVRYEEKFESLTQEEDEYGNYHDVYTIKKENLI